MFYAYAEEYKHNDRFLKTEQVFTTCSKQNFIELLNVCDPYTYRYVCCEMNAFFEIFINHFSEQSSLYNFNILRKKTDSNIGVFLCNL